MFKLTVDVRVLPPVLEDKEERTIRIVPPTWADAYHFGLSVFYHAAVYSDAGELNPLCPNFMSISLSAIGIDMPVKDLLCSSCISHPQSKPDHAVMYYVIDRAHESDRPSVYFASADVDKRFCYANLGVKKIAQLPFGKAMDLSGEVLEIDHPETGYDLTLKYDNGNPSLRTLMSEVVVADEPSPMLSDAGLMNKVLEFATEHPLPTLLKF